MLSVTRQSPRACVCARAGEGTVRTRMAYTFIPNPGGAGAWSKPTGCPSFFCRSIEKDHDVKNVQVSGGKPNGTHAPLEVIRTFQNNAGYQFFQATPPPTTLLQSEEYELVVTYDIVAAVDCETFTANWPGWWRSSVADNIEYSLVLGSGVDTDTQVTVEPAGSPLASRHHGETRVAYTASQLQIGMSSPHDVVWTIKGVEMPGCFPTVAVVLSIVAGLVAISLIWIWCCMSKKKQRQQRDDVALGLTSLPATAEVAQTGQGQGALIVAHAVPVHQAQQQVIMAHATPVKAC